LDPGGKKNCSYEEFARRGEAFHRDLGFTPDELFVRTCDEQGSEGVSRVVLAGREAGQTRRRNDGVALRRTEVGWRVVLPPNFGVPTR
jgi:hypothetical protein